MLIGIDASRAVSSSPTGTENYSRFLIKYLAKLRRNTLRLYFNSPPPQEFYIELLGFSSLEFRVIPFPRLWTHFRLSLEMALYPPDVLFVPAHVIPLIHPKTTVVTIHDLGFKYFPKAHPFLQRLYLDLSTRYNALVASVVIADSKATCGDLVKFYRVPIGKIRVVYPGLDPAVKPVMDRRRVEKVKSRYGIEGDYFLYVGTIQPRKNLKRLVEAFALFRQETSAPVKLVMAGKPGWLYQEAIPAPREDLILTGYVPRDDLMALMSGAKLFVFPSLYEGFGFPVLEAMACGVPVMCSKTSSLPELAEGIGFLVDPLDVEEMARVMVKVWREGVPEETILKGRERAASFSWEKCAQAVMQILEGV
ncbi:MAG: glycosyltransferase family 1 protein [Anaerolineae bacterium]|nr:glycosyltransferase family 4 protein [Anaerolineae bacterium]MDW8102305.1 glycosyltransferase family 1 protein [Anaerolineae bacterium]